MLGQSPWHPLRYDNESLPEGSSVPGPTSHCVTIKGLLPFAKSQRQAENRSQPFVGTHLGTMASSEKSPFLSALFPAQRKSKTLPELDAGTCMGESICERVSMSGSAQKLGLRRNTNLARAKKMTLLCSQEMV